MGLAEGLADNIRKRRTDTTEPSRSVSLLEAAIDVGHDLIDARIILDGLGKAVAATHAVAESAAEEANLLDRHGDFSKWRLARAAVRPSRTVRQLVTGAAKGAAAVASGARTSIPGDTPATDGSTGPDPTPHVRAKTSRWSTNPTRVDDPRPRTPEER